MATIEEIMAAKDPQFKSRLLRQLGEDLQSEQAVPIIQARMGTPPEEGHETPPHDVVAPAAPKVSPLGDEDLVKATLPATDHDLTQGVPKTKGGDALAVNQQQPSPGQDDDLQRAIEDADRRANLKYHMRRVAALFSQGARDPEKIDLSDINAIRQRPLEIYKARQEAKKQAAEQLLQAAQARHYGAETEAIPQRLSLEQQRAADEAQYRKGELAARATEETGRTQREREQRESAERIAAMKVQVERETAGHFSVATDPITGDQRIFNVHTGAFTGAPLGTATPAAKEQYQRRKLLTPQENKDLDTGEQAAGDVANAQEQVKKNPGAFGGLSNLAETVVGRVPIVGAALAPRAGAALRSPEEQQARMAALTAAASRIHEIAGTRGFSKTERDYMNNLVPGPNDSAAMVMNKLKEAERVNNEHVSRIRQKLPGESTPKRGDTRIGPNGKRQVWVPD